MSTKTELDIWLAAVFSVHKMPAKIDDSAFTDAIEDAERWFASLKPEDCRKLRDEVLAAVKQFEREQLAKNEPANTQ